MCIACIRIFLEKWFKCHTTVDIHFCPVLTAFFANIISLSFACKVIDWLWMYNCHTHLRFVKHHIGQRVKMKPEHVVTVPYVAHSCLNVLLKAL